MQDGVVDLDIRVLELKRHHVEDMLALALVGYHSRSVIKPPLNIANAVAMRARVTPPIAIDEAVLGNENALPCRVGDADKGAGTHCLTVLVETNGCFDATTAVDRLARDMAKERIERRPTNLAPILHIKEALVVLDIGEAFVPFCLLGAGKLFTLDFSDKLGSLVGERLGRGYFFISLLECSGDQFFSKSMLVLGAALFCDPA